MLISHTAVCNDEIDPRFKVDKMALQLYWRGEFEKALKRLDKSLASNPNQAKAWNMRGLINFYTLKKYEAAKKDFAKAIAIEPHFVFPYTNRGWIYLLTDDYALAKEDFQKHIELKPEKPFGYYKMGVLEYYQGNPKDAIIYFNQSLKKDSSNSLSAIFKYFVLKENKQNGERWLQEYLKKNPSTFVKNEIELYLGNLTPADYFEKKDIAVNPNVKNNTNTRRCSGHFHLGKFYSISGNPKMALDHFNKSIHMKNCDMNLEKILAEKEIQRISIKNKTPTKKSR